MNVQKQRAHDFSPSFVILACAIPNFPSAGAVEQLRQAALATTSSGHARDTVSSGDRRMSSLSGRHWYTTVGITNTIANINGERVTPYVNDSVS
jgi:hypothetical protein